MTPFPHAIDADASAADAQAMMEQHGIRHLPVTDGTEIVGVLSDRDIQHFLDPLIGVPAVHKIRDIMITDPYVVRPADPIDEVLFTLAERRIGCAIIANDGRLKGIFTTTDASRILAQHFRDGRRSGDDDQA